MFLTDPELAILTGRRWRSRQIDALRKMGIPFVVNAAGRPVVTKSALEGKEQPKQQRWEPRA